jgi:hypothetical protein
MPKVSFETEFDAEEQVLFPHNQRMEVGSIVGVRYTEKDNDTAGGTISYLISGKNVEPNKDYYFEDDLFPAKDHYLVT